MKGRGWLGVSLSVATGEHFRAHYLVANGIISGTKTETVRMDKAGRVVLPKPLREQFHLLPGDKLRLSVDGNGFRLVPAEPGGALVKEGSVLRAHGKTRGTAIWRD